ncbi:MAG: helix-hairpin-helix domain-containing protein [Pseudomonadota bacterium]
MPIQNPKIADFLVDVANLLELDSASPFRVRAYRNAADTVRHLRPDLAGMVEAGDDLTELEGIGGAIADKIEEIVRTGHLAYLDELAKGPPGPLLALLRVPGLGPGRVRALREALGIQSIPDLEAALQAGQVRGIPGFGAKSESSLIETLATLDRDS